MTSRSAIVSNTASVIATAAGAGSRVSRSTRSPIPPCAGIIAHSRDITRRKANEHILSLNYARYRTVADLSAGAVHEYVMNAQGVYELEWALGTERVYGCSEEEYRRRGWQSFHVSQGWEEASLARTQRYQAGETVEFTVPIRRTDGQVRWVEVKNRPHRRSGHRQVHAPGGRRRSTSPSASRRPTRCAKANFAIARWPS